MKAYNLTAPGRFEVQDIPAPDPDRLEPGEVIIRVEAVALCGSDLAIFHGGGGWRRDDPEHQRAGPGHPCHEVVGTVIVTRDTSVAEGTRIVGWASRSDALRELVVTRTDVTTPLNAPLEPAYATMIQPLACVLYAVDSLPQVEGSNVTVIGLGPIGLLFCHILKARGARTVSGLDRVDRRDIADKFGIDNVFWQASEKWSRTISDADRPDIVIEAAGHQQGSLDDALQAIRPGGFVYLFGMPDDLHYAIDMHAMFAKNLTIRAGITSERHRYLEMADAYAQTYPQLPRDHVSHVFPMSEVNASYELASVPAVGRLKIALTAT
jgi:L-iditol 2-dehydrogenase